MTYESMMLRDRELLEVMYLARKHQFTTVGLHVVTTDRQMIHAENGDIIQWLTCTLHWTPC